jgi:hypothetical protein
MSKPINKANLAINSELPAAGDVFLVADIVPSLSPGTIRINICLSIDGVVSLTRTVSATTVQEKLNAGVALTAGVGYIFEIPWVAGEEINLICSTPALAGSDCADGTGTLKAPPGSPVLLAMGTNTLEATGDGNFTATLAVGLTGIAQSKAGGATIIGSPQALVAGANVVDTGITTGEFYIIVTGGQIRKLQIDESWSGH